MQNLSIIENIAPAEQVDGPISPAHASNRGANNLSRRSKRRTATVEAVLKELSSLCRETWAPTQNANQNINISKVSQYLDTRHIFKSEEKVPGIIVNFMKNK
jgi:hypothetical protein